MKFKFAQDSHSDKRLSPQFEILLTEHIFTPYLTTLQGRQEERMKESCADGKNN